jgi:hypothetical protein
MPSCSCLLAPATLVFVRKANSFNYGRVTEVDVAGC